MWVSARGAAPPLWPCCSDESSQTTHFVDKHFCFVFYSQINELPKPSCMLKTLRELRIGTYENIEIATEETSIITALHKFVERRVSALPLVDAEGRLVDIYAKFDVIVSVVWRTDTLRWFEGEARAETNEQPRWLSEFSRWENIQRFGCVFEKSEWTSKCLVWRSAEMSTGWNAVHHHGADCASGSASLGGGGWERQGYWYHLLVGHPPVFSIKTKWIAEESVEHFVAIIAFVGWQYTPVWLWDEVARIAEEDESGDLLEMKTIDENGLDESTGENATSQIAESTNETSDDVQEVSSSEKVSQGEDASPL